MKIKDYAKVDLIFQASLQLIEVEGISGLTMAKLSKKAGIATGTLYIYFKNKEMLFSELYEKLKKESLARFFEGYSADMPFYMGIKVIWMNYLNHRIDYYKESIFLEQYYRTPYVDDKINHIANSMKKPVIKHINTGKEQGLVKQNIDSEMLFYSMLGFIRELADEHVLGHYNLTPEKREQAFQLSWETIRI